MMNAKNYFDTFKELPYEKKEEIFRLASESLEKAEEDNDGAKINRIEKTLTRILSNHWNNTSTKAINKALKTFPKNDKRFTKKDSDKVLSSLTKSYKGVEKKNSKRVESDLREIYEINKKRFGSDFKLSSTDGEKKKILTFEYLDFDPLKKEVTKKEKIVKKWKKSKVLKAVTFGAIDEAAYENLARLENVSIGDHFPKTKKPQVSRILETSLERGMSHNEASVFLEQELTAALGGNIAPALPASVATGKASTAAYFEMLNATNVTYSRNFGQINLMNEAGITSLIFNAIIDRTTSVVCNQMNGRIFTIQQAMSHQQKVLGAPDVETLQQLSPFTRNLKDFGLKEGQKLTNSKVSADLAAAGVICPPLHGRCRSELQPA